MATSTAETDVKQITVRMSVDLFDRMTELVPLLQAEKIERGEGGVASVTDVIRAALVLGTATLRKRRRP